MTISGAQANQTTGGPQPWEPGSVQDKGIDDIRKMGLGVVSDSLLKPISDMNRQMVWKYDSASTNPSLSAPLRQLRGADEFGQGSAPTWGNFYDQLIEALPPDVKAELLNQKDQLFTNRDPSYAALDMLLQFTAMGMNQASNVDAPIPSNSAAEVRQSINYAVPGIALNAVLDSSLEVIQNVADLINTFGEVGDNFSLSLAQLEGVILGRDQLIAIAQQLIYPTPSDAVTGPTIQELASDPSAFTGAIKLSGEGQGLGILSATLYALETVAFAASLKMGSPPLYLGLVIATKDSDAPREQGGCVGPELQKIILGFTQTIDTLFGVRDRPGGSALLEPLITAFAAIILGATALIFEEGIAALPIDSPQERNTEQRFSAELTLKLIATSKTFDEIASGVVVSGEIPSSSQQLAANGLTLGTLLLVAYTASLQGGETQDSVLNLLQPEMQPLFEQLNQSGVGMLSPALGMFLQQGLLALQEGNPAALAAAMEQGLQRAGISPAQLKSDLQQMQTLANGIATGAAEGMDDKTDTGTSIQFVTA